MNATSPNDDDDDMLSFADEDGDTKLGAASAWQVLIVDDDPDIHATTELALRGLDILGRRIEFLHAHSAAQAQTIIDAEPNLAVILLDVVMETSHAGLDLARYIRAVACRPQVRIVLRTGQPGYAPEIDTIRDYDINDYKTKTELTRTHLFTTLTVAIRSYQQLRQLDATREGLESIINGSLDLSRLRGLKSFSEGVVVQLCALLGVENEGLVCAVRREAPLEPLVVATSKRYAAMMGQRLSDCSEQYSHITKRLLDTLNQRKTTLDKQLGLYFPVQGMCGMAAYIDVGALPSDIDTRLLEIFCSNITAGFDNVLLTERLSDLAWQDPQLELPNRNALIRWIDEGANEDTVLAQIDLDGFADISSALDHTFGDLVLKAVATRLAQHFPAPTRLARVGGDVFGLLGSPNIVTAAAIKQVFADPFLIDGQLLRLSATSGFLKLTPHAGVDGVEAIQKSTVAVWHAKRDVRGHSLQYDESQAAHVRDRMNLLNQLRSALPSNRLFLVYQPCIDVGNGRVIGAEALLRCRTEDGAIIPPDRFISLAEESGLMVPIGSWVVRSALQELRRLMDLGYDDFRMAINVSLVQFREPDFVAQLAHTIAECGVPAANVELELTESVAAENTQMLIDKLQQIRQLGVTIAFDDFGTGYSSLSILRQLPLNRIKIDRSFINVMGDDDSFVKLIVNLGDQLGLQIIAEGIETHEQWKTLKAMGCDEGQGYLFSRPVEPDALTRVLADWKETV